MFPDDLGYTSQHEWVRRGAGNVIRVGITSYAAKELGDVVFVSLPQVGEEVAADDACAEVESTKDVSGVYTPLAGVITAVNDALTESPETINSDPYGEGWLFELEVADPEQVGQLLSADAYSELVSG
ncbi:MAG: glycine cleavage system protein GcvH [Propionicimonas sp.]